MKGKRLLAAALALTLAGSMLTAPASAATFTDLNGHWAQADVEYLSSQGLASGYSDGTFKPDAAMSTVEALLFCSRVTGLDASTKAAIKEDWLDTLEDILPADMVSWASADLSVCLETGIITADELKAICDRDGLLKAIEREDVMQYLARAMQLSAMAEGLSTYPLSFSDADQVSSEMRPYVYILSTYGVVKGDEQGRFLPKSSLNRASMTSVLRRALSFMKERGIVVELPGRTSYSWVGGTIAAATVGNGGTISLTLTEPLGSTRTVTLPASVKIYENNMLSGGSALKNGSYARVNMNRSGTAAEVRVSGALETVSGSVSGLKDGVLTLLTGGQTRSYQLDRFIQVQAGKAVGGSELLDESAAYSAAVCYVDELGHVAAVRLSGGTREEVGLLSEVKISSSGAATIQVVSMSGVKTRYTVPSGAGITVDGKAGKLSTGHVGDYVTLRVSNDDSDTVAALEVDTATPYVQGSIKSVSYAQSPSKITITDLSNGKTVTYTIDSKADVTYDGGKIALSALEKGWYVTLRLTGTEVSAIMAYPGSSTEEGIITSITYGTPTVLEVTRDDGTVLSFDIDLTDPPEIYRDDVRSSIDKLKNGDEVVVTVRYHEVSAIEATPKSANATGVIKRVTMDTAGTTIDVEMTGGGTESYLVSEGVSVTQNGKAVSIDSLKPGFKISMVLEGDEILSIEVDKNTTSANQLSGTVLYVNTASKEILLQKTDTSGTTSVLTVDASAAELRSAAGGSLVLRDLESGDTVLVFGSYDGLTFKATLLIRT